MIEDFYFLDQGHIKITAASVGISKNRWVSISENDINTDNHIKIMSDNKFDHLPIISKNDNVFEYFKTNSPNDFSNIERLKINYDDLIPLETPIETVIEKFSDKRTFYFLTFQNNISGIITIGNLNCKQVQVYLFSKICELERELGNFLNDSISKEKILNWLKKKIDKNNEKCKYNSIITEYEKLVSLDLENQLTEHFFLVDFFKIISDLRLYEKFNLSKTKWNDFSSINELRKKIAHPTRSLIDQDNSIIKLKERIDKMNDLIFKLNLLSKL